MLLVEDAALFSVAACFRPLLDKPLDSSAESVQPLHYRRHRMTAQCPGQPCSLHPCAAGHSLGGFTAVSCAVLCDRIHSAVAFEAPGLTTFYHRAAACRGGPGFWRERVTTYLAIPNPINMCQSHLGRIVRCARPARCRSQWHAAFFYAGPSE